MITRDYLLRQIQQMVQVLARVLMLRTGQQHDQAIEVIDQALRDIPGLEVLLRPNLTQEELLDLCRTQDGFHADKAVALADLLREKALLLHDEVNCRVYARRALWLYEAAMATENAAVPWDIFERTTSLKELLGNEEN